MPTVRLRYASEYPEPVRKMFELSKQWFSHDFSAPPAMSRVMAWDPEFGGPHGRAGGVNLRASEGKRGARPLEGDLVWPWIDHEEKLPPLDLLIVADRKVDDVPVYLGSDADEVRAHGGVVGPRTVLPLPDRDRDGGRGAQENERAHRAAQHTTRAGGRLIRVGPRLSHGTRSARGRG